MRSGLPPACVTLLLVACRLGDSPLEGVPLPPLPDAAPPDAAPPTDAGPPLDASPCDGEPAPIVEWIFDRAADPRAPVPDRAAAEPYVPLLTADRDPVGVSLREDGAVFSGGLLEADLEDSRALGLALVARRAFTVEVWAETPRDDATGPGRIVTYSSGAFTRAFSILQNAGALEVRLRTSVTDDNGLDLAMSTPDVFPATDPRQIAVTYDGATGLATVYVDGAQVAQRAHTSPDGSPAALSWDVDQERVGCGDEFDVKGNSRAWTGTLHAVRIWDAALTEEHLACAGHAPNP
jgi:hypothetical protein